MYNLALALGLDILLGDPSWLPHPVIAMGKLIREGEDFIRPRIAHERLAGLLLVLVVVGLTFGLSTGLIYIAYSLHPTTGKLLSILLIFTTLSLRALEQAAKHVFRHLDIHDLPGARQAVSHLVGRDTDHMDDAQIVRATIESVAENSVDGLIAPFFYAFLGGAPLALAYKAVNTLDSMIGYRNERYMDFGWAAARLDDAVNYVPARLSYILIPLAGGVKRMAQTVNIIGRDGRKHPSPNSGLAEAGFAAALGVQLGGENRYEGKTSSRPLLGDKERELTREDILRATNLLYRLTFALFCLFSLVWMRA